MTRPTTRVLALLELLQTHGRISGAELARRLGVDPRTLRRYINTLEDIGIPITTERGRYGGYMLVAGFKLPPLMFTADEAVAVSLGLLAVGGLGLADTASAVASAQAKLERVMPDGLKSQVRAISEAAVLAAQNNGFVADSAALATLAKAAQERKRVQVEYRASAAAPSRREIDPYGVVYWRARWYVVGFCHLRQDLRSFRLDRIICVRVSDTRFTRPAGFDSSAYLKTSIATMPRSLEVQVLLHADLDKVLTLIPDSAGVFTPAGEGVLLRTHADSVSWLARHLAALPCRFEVLAPDELRMAVRAHAEQLLAMTGCPASVPVKPG